VGKGKERPRGILDVVVGIGAKQVAMIDSFHSHKVDAKPELLSTFAMSIYPRYGELERMNIGESCVSCRFCHGAFVGNTSQIDCR
jgi:hypothetical protein